MQISRGKSAVVAIVLLQERVLLQSLLACAALSSTISVPRMFVANARIESLCGDFAFSTGLAKGWREEQRDGETELGGIFHRSLILYVHLDYHF